jgi:hypothetical protein
MGRRSAVGNLLLAVALGGCLRPDTAAVARMRAEQALQCRGADLVSQSLGELVLRPRDPLRVRVHESWGCKQSVLYFCRTDRRPVECNPDPVALLGEDLGADARTALHVRRTASRARCPTSDERVVQESDTLFRFEACDGTWLHHCRATGCTRLSRLD